MRHNRFIRVCIYIIALMAFIAQELFAAGTAADTTISNTATVNFKVTGVALPPVSSLPTTFKVDRKINLTVAEVGGASTSVVPGSTNQVLTFTVTNTSNATLDFRLVALDDTTPPDHFDPTNLRVFADTNGNGTFESDTDTLTFLDEVPADTTKTVFVVADIPFGPLNGQTTGITLTAFSASSGGSPGTLGPDMAETAGADTPDTVDTVFADPAGDTDQLRDGSHSDDDLYLVQIADISVIKTATVISDPFNLTTNPKAIPGATIEYCIQISNSGSGPDATENVTISDQIPVNTTFVSGTIFSGGTMTGGVCNADGSAVSDANGFSASPPTVTTTVGSVAAGATVTSRFRVTVSAFSATITNTATVNFKIGGVLKPPKTASVVTPILPSPTPAVVAFYTFIQNSAPLPCLFATDGTLSPSSPKPCALQADGTFVRNPSGTFSQISPPKTFTGNPISLINPVAVIPTDVYHAGDPVFMTLADGNRNADPNVREVIEVTLTVATGDDEVLRLQETGPNTGIFAGVIQSISLVDPLADNNGLLSIAPNTTITVSYMDPDFPSDVVETKAFVDPFGIVFNSVTGARVNGATVSLMVDSTGLPASVFADDGSTFYPSTVTSGAQVTTTEPGKPALDARNKVYVFADGEFRFPLVAPGDYRLVVIPPPGFSAPSTVPLSKLQSDTATKGLKTGNGSFADRFTVAPGIAFHVDIPIDPGTLVVEKIVNRIEATAGDFLSYQIGVSNKGQGQANAVVLTDILPIGFRYQSGSARKDSVPIPDPAISADGRTLTFSIGTILPSIKIEIRYVIEVTAGTPSGIAVNHAQARGAAVAGEPIISNLAQVAVKVRPPFFSAHGTLIGRVVEGECDTPWENLVGVPNARLIMEDGTYVTTDRDGQYHFEKVEKGTHVVQLDIDSLGSGWEVISCIQNTRFADRSYSQFVEMEGGMLWRADFYLHHKKPKTPIDLKAPILPYIPIILIEGSVGISLHGQIEVERKLNLAERFSLKSNFDTNKAQLKPTDQNALNTLASSLKNINIERIEVIGHTDSRPILGAARLQFQDNYVLSMARADVVAKYLSKALDIPLNRFLVSGRGPDDPISENKTAHGLSLNRRTEVRILTAAASGALGVPKLAYHLDIDGSKVPVAALRVMVNLPADLRIKPGTATMNGVPFSTLFTDGDVIVFSLNHTETDFARRIDFEVEGIAEILQNKGCLNGTFLAKAVALFHTESEKNLKTPTVSNHIPCNPPPSPSDRHLDQARALTHLEVSSNREMIITKGNAESNGNDAGEAGPKDPAKTNIASPTPRSDRTPIILVDDATAAGGNTDWLVGQTPEIDWLFPPLNHNPRAQVLRVVIKHLPGQEVALSVNNEPVNLTKSDGVTSNESVSITSFRGIPIQEGDNTLNALILDADGQVVTRLTRIVHFSGSVESALFLPQSSYLFANGAEKPLLAAQLLDKNGYPVRSGTTGFYTMIASSKGAIPRSERLPLNPESSKTSEQPAEATPKNLVKWQVQGDDGIAYLALNPTTDAGEVLIRFLSDEDATTSAVSPPGDANITIPVDDATAAGGNTDWLLGQTPEIDWLFPPLNHNPRAPVLRVVIKHLPHHTASLKLKGKPIDSIAPLSFDGTRISADKKVAVSIWRGIPLQNGDNPFIASVIDGATGEVMATISRVVHYSNRPAHVEFMPDKSILIADGINSPVLAVRVTDKEGRPVRSGVTGYFSIDPPFLPEQIVDETQRRQLAGMDVFKPMWQVTGDEGIARIKLKPTTQTGEMVAVFPFEWEIGLFGEKDVRSEAVRGFIESAPRDFIVVGFAEGTVGYNTLKGNMEALSAEGTKDNFFTEGDIRFYAKGRIRGDWLLTLAVDSDKPSSRRESLFQVIDPNAFYTLYGDGTGQGYDASSQRKIYLKLERHQFYALFGDFETGLTKSELLRYSRSLNGFKIVSKGRQLLFEAFAAETPQTFARDEIQGAGTSGLYRLSRGGIVLNGEQVRIETRDRLRSERIIETRSLTRHIDYDIDYPNGTLFFREPIPSRDTSFNPVFIVVEYEVAGGADDLLNIGGRVGVKLGEWKGVTGDVGFSYIRNAERLTKADLGGIDLKINIPAGNEVRFEAAASSIRTDGIGGGVESGSAYLVEAVHHDRGWDALLYTRLQESDFGVNQQNGAQGGIRKTGAIGKMALTQNVIIFGEGSREENLVLSPTRDVVATRLEYSEKAGRAFVGLRSARDESSSGASFHSQQVVAGASRKLWKGRLELEGNADLSLGGENESLDYPSRYLLQAGWRLTEATRLIIAHEISNGDSFDTSQTRAGLQSNPWKGARLTTTLNQGINEYGPRTFGVMGLSQSLLLGERWGVDFAIDQSHIYSESSAGAPNINPNYPIAVGGTLGNGVFTEDYVALSAGATYRHNLWSWNGRVENRHGEIDKRFGLTTGLLREAKAGVAFSSSLRLFQTDRTSGSEGILGNVDFAVAYRPLGTYWSVLNRFLFRHETLENGTGAAGSQLFGNNSLMATHSAKSRALVNHFNFNIVSRAWEGKDREGNLFHLNQRNQGSLYYGSKYSFDQYDGVDYKGYTDLLGLDMRHDFMNRLMDIGFHGEMLHSWNARNYKYSVGPMIGIAPIENVWITLGYNVLGFYDRDFGEARYTATGPYLKLRIKFDQNTTIPRKDVGTPEEKEESLENPVITEAEQEEGVSP